MADRVRVDRKKAGREVSVASSSYKLESGRLPSLPERTSSQLEHDALQPSRATAARLHLLPLDPFPSLRLSLHADLSRSTSQTLLSVHSFVPRSNILPSPVTNPPSGNGRASSGRNVFPPLLLLVIIVRKEMGDDRCAVLGEEVELGRVEVVVRDVFRDPKEVRRRRSQRLALC
jgi:hypothetical protein